MWYLRGCGVALAAAALISLIGVSPAGAAVTCTYDPASRTVYVTMAAVSTVTIARTPAGVIVCNGSNSGGTVFATDTIDVRGDGSSQALTLNLASGAFAPGATPEAPGISEIELLVALGGGANTVTIEGDSAAGDALNVGSGGVALNADADNDVTYSGMHQLTLRGHGGNDALSAGGGAVTGQPYGMFARSVRIEGGLGADTLTGGRGGDVLLGGDGDDTLSGGRGNDTLDGQTGNDVHSGDEESDTLRVNIGSDRFNGGTGNDHVGGVLDRAVPDGADVFSGGPGTDTLQTFRSRVSPVRISLDGVANDGQDGDQNGVAEEADNVGADVEVVQLGRANDTFNAAAAPGVLLRSTFGNEGDDAITGSRASDSVDGGAGSDAISALGANDTLFGRAGNDSLNGGDDVDSVFGEDGGDTLLGGADNDALHGGNDNDVLRGGDGDDSVNGNLGQDQVFGDAGDDQAIEPSMNDGADLLDGGSGFDFLNLTARTSGQVIILDNVANDGTDADANGIAEERDDVRAGWERVQTGPGPDVLDARAAAGFVDNRFDAGGGGDRLYGGTGMDILNGSDGNDAIDGGAGEDQLFGANGDDSLSARDRQTDTVDCGAGTDGAQVDDGLDVLLGCEVVTVGNGFGNGSFETPMIETAYLTLAAAATIGPWRVTDGEVDIMFTWATAQHGRQSIDMSGFVGGRICQSFATTPVATYDVAFWMSHNAVAVATASLSAGVTGGTAHRFAHNAASTNEDPMWERHAFAFVAAGSSSELCFASSDPPVGSGPDGAAMLDNVTVTRR